MIKKGFLTNNTRRNSKDTRHVSVAGRSILYLGVVILITTLVYMIVNFSKADTIILVWLPFMIAGVILVFMSQLINWNYLRHHR
jgi:hypothetical protein